MFTYYKTYKELVQEAIDLGLPSGTLWATMNVGASKPSDAGLYFQWGDTQGYTKKQVGKDKQFTWSDYKWYSGSTFTKYENEGVALQLEDDAAHVNMGGNWHMPTPEQCQELIDNTTSEWTTQDSVKGRLFTSKKNASKFIFIPAAGVAWDGSVYSRGNNGVVWSSMLSSSDVSLGQNLYFDSGTADLSSYYDRDYGFSVRGVIG